ncbi:hypothetical protein CF326_g9058 [Tilletia indica]|nr:hypothetical protein CF326_g9058 [Tilletia indica]
MPTVLAVSLAIEAEQSAKRKALGTHTAPIEKIPAVTIPFSDKTSTVKTNKIIIDPETGKLSSKGQTHQRGDHPRLREREDTRVPSVRIASSTPATYVELVEYLFDGTIKRISGVYRSTTDYPHRTDNVAQVYFVKDAVEPDLLAGSNTVFSREETKDSEAAMLLIREIDEGMRGSLSHGDYGEQVPSNSRPCSTFRRGVVHSTSTSASVIGIEYGPRMFVPPASGTPSHSVSAQNPSTSPPIRRRSD